MVRQAWLKQGKIDRRDDNGLTETSGNHTMMVNRTVTQDQDHLYTIESSRPKSWKYKQTMDNFNCEYDDVVEAVDLYNLDVEECTVPFSLFADPERILRRLYVSRRSHASLPTQPVNRAVQYLRRLSQDPQSTQI